MRKEEAMKPKLSSRTIKAWAIFKGNYTSGDWVYSTKKACVQRIMTFVYPPNYYDVKRVEIKPIPTKRGKRPNNG